MSRAEITRNLLLAVVLFLLQVLLLKSVSLGWVLGGFFYLHIVIYPATIMLLPLRTHWLAVILIAFSLGMLVDAFYESPGVHASAAVVVGYFRRYILAALSPPEGYNMAHRLLPDNLGFPWFFRYTAIFMSIFLLWYYIVEVFTFYYFGQILLKTISTFLVSMLVLWMGLMIYRPKKVNIR